MMRHLYIGHIIEMSDQDTKPWLLHDFALILPCTTTATVLVSTFQMISCIDMEQIRTSGPNRVRW